MADLVELDMVNFDVILGMGQVHACYTLVYCINQVVMFLFLSEPVIEWRNSLVVPKGRFISYLKVKKFVPKGASITQYEVMTIVLRHHLFSQFQL